MTDESSVPPAKALAEFTENVFAPEVFASEAAFFSIAAGNLTITFASYRWDNSTRPATQRRVVVGRLVMPVLGGQHLAAALYNYLKKKGLIPHLGHRIQCKSSDW